jgi:hypothetical protein
LVLFALATLGCATTRDARYVYQDGQYGVVGIPEDSTHWPRDYRAQAERLMSRHFPQGFEIVLAEEVVEGSRTRTTAGTVSAELAPALPTDLVTVAKFGRTATSNQSDTLKIKECRIIYRKADRAPFGSFADEAAHTPELYIDPNECERRTLAAKVEKSCVGAEKGA